MLAACGGSSPQRPSDPRQELRQAKQVIDGSSAVHFELSSSGTVPSTTPEVTGGSGDAVRPSQFQGLFKVLESGLTLDVNVVSVNHTFWAKLVITGWQQVNPSNYGFADPGTFLDPNHGLSNLLVTTKTASYAASDRLPGTGEQLDEIDATLPGPEVAALLTSADPNADVHAVFGIDPSTHQMRRVVLTGPFWAKGVNSTYTVIATNYGENVQITPPS